uniref:Ig-like domain-containing protein n=1 Tax=Sander lucioperca TaxID=283035 RepID=A0A8C9XRT7_SANLU
MLFLSLLPSHCRHETLCKGEDRVIQPTGDTVTLDCTFETIYSNPTLFWYKQKENDFPKYMLKHYSNTKDNAPDFQKEKFDSTINKTSVPLKIQKLQLSDSAVYYCALRPTVTENPQSLYKNTRQHYQVGGALLLHCRWNIGCGLFLLLFSLVRYKEQHGFIIF